MQILRSSWLVLVACLIGGLLLWFRPGGVEGPRAPAVPVAGKGFEHAAFTAVLAAVIRPDGSVDYGRLKADRAPLDLYLGQLRAVSPESAAHRFKGDDDRLAYYLNAHNAFTLAVLRDHCPVENVNTLYPAGGLFWRVSFLMGEAEVTLGDVETAVRGAQGRDPHVRFALNKGGRGFAPLPTAAFEGATVRAQLVAHAQAALALPRLVKVEGDTVHLSKLFEWYAADFGDALGYIERTRPGTVPGVGLGATPTTAGSQAVGAPGVAADGGAPQGTPKAAPAARPKVVYTAFDWALNGDCGG